MGFCGVTESEGSCGDKDSLGQWDFYSVAGAARFKHVCRPRRVHSNLATWSNPEGENPAPGKFITLNAAGHRHVQPAWRPREVHQFPAHTGLFPGDTAETKPSCHGLKG